MLNIYLVIIFGLTGGMCRQYRWQDGRYTKSGTDGCVDYLRADDDPPLCACGCLDKLNGTYPMGHFMNAYYSLLKILYQGAPSERFPRCHDIYKFDFLPNGRLLFLGVPLASWLFRVTWIWSYGENNNQSAKDLEKRIKYIDHRALMYTREENELFMRGDSFYSESDGKELLNSVQALGRKKGAVKGAYIRWVIEAFVKPLEKLKETRRLIEFLKDVNAHLIKKIYF